MNKEIIIDGKGCRYKTQDAECSLTGDHHGDNMKPCKFIDEKSCYFKQQARKMQECEELKKDLQDYESWFDEYKILFTYDGRTPVTNDELYTCLEELVKKGNDETSRYHKALEEIEKILKDEICEECPGKEGCKAGCKEHQCLDIINKAKGEINE